MTVNTTIITSPDGLAWTRRANGWDPGLDTAVTGGNAVAWNGSLAVAVTASGNGTSIQTSPDGITWTPRTSPLDSAGGTTQAVAVAWSPMLGLWVVTNGAPAGSAIYSSPDGITWTARASGFDTQGALSVVWADALALFVVGGFRTSSGHVIATSPDGITWTEQTSDFDSRPTATAEYMGWDGALLVASGKGPFGTGANAAEVETSPDGITWTDNLPSVRGTSQGVAGTGSLWVLCGANFDRFVHTPSLICTSPAGAASWTNQTTPWDANVNAFAVFPAWSADLGQWVVVGTDGLQTHMLLTSPDGVTWTEQTTPMDGPGSTFSPAGFGAVWAHELGLWIVVGQGTAPSPASPAMRWSVDTVRLG